MDRIAMSPRQSSYPSGRVSVVTLVTLSMGGDPTKGRPAGLLTAYERDWHG
jgi:hypothetical protein